MANKTDVRMFTSIHTTINENYRISTIFRKYANSNFTSWAWETLVWKKELDKEKIIDQWVSDSFDEIMKTHKKFFEKYQLKEESE